jgi:hypothetical protein
MQYILIVLGAIIIVPFAMIAMITLIFAIAWWGVIVSSSLTYALYRDKEDLYYAGCINSENKANWYARMLMGLFPPLVSHKEKSHE